MTTIIPTIEPHYVPERAQVSRGSRGNSKGKLAKGLLISTLVHLIGLVMVVIMTKFENPVSPSHQSLQKPAPINATLYFPPISVKNPVTQPPVEPASTSETPKPATKVVDNVKRAATPTEPDVIPETIEAPKPALNTAPPMPVSTENAHPPTTPLTTSATTKNQQAGRLNLSPRASTAQFLNQREQQAVAEEGIRAAQEFQRKKQSPDLIDSRKDKEEVLIQRPVKKVNCTSTAGKTVAVLSAFTGGTLKCTKLNGHDNFIDARVNKTPIKD